MVIAHKIITVVIVLTIALFAGVNYDYTEPEGENVVLEETTTQIDISETTTKEEETTETTTVTVEETTETTTVVTTTTPTTTTNPETTKANLDISETDVELLARICMCEAEGQSEYGQRLVIDVVLNRVDDGRFPDSVYGVIFQKGQFTPTTNGRWDRCYAKESLMKLAREEIESRTNSEVLYFNEGGYPSYATPVCCVGAHYFSR